MQFIDLKSRHFLIKDQINARIQTVMEHGQFILGPEVRELEQKLAEYTGSKHCITVSSGTDSLLIALMALGVGSGDEIITVPYTWISTAEVIALLGATPVFVDVRSDTWNMDETLLEASITERTKAIMPVSIYGQTPDMDAINEIAKKYELPVIEDAAQSFGATYKGRKSCNLSTIGSTSFFPSKPLGCYGDAGALFTNEDALAEKFRWIRVHGQERKHHHPIVGLNGRMDTLQAAISRGSEVVIIDTAGRMHNKRGLMEELTKIRRVMEKIVPGAPHEVLLGLDGSTGQNAVEQAKQFMAATEVTGLVLTKLDGTAKGGVVLAISAQLHIPVRFIGVGEKMEDLQDFHVLEFIDSLLPEKLSDGLASVKES